uniref:Uncharacterized protein n=1 Tax=Rhizophora mucronata TaxID=61149 RepID=A0A2P2J1I2_RHIMU
MSFKPLINSLRASCSSSLLLRSFTIKFWFSVSKSSSSSSFSLKSFIIVSILLIISTSPSPPIYFITFTVPLSCSISSSNACFASSCFSN